jgi:hypothetical protein
MLTPAQSATLRAAIIAETDAAFVVARTQGATGTMAAFYNQNAADFYVWRSSTPVNEIMDAVAWAAMTPVDAPDGTAAYTNRALACQGKQFNLQTLLVGREQVNSARTNIRAALQDALTSLPSGAGGATQSGGWVAVREAMKRLAKRGEKLYVTGGNGALATPATLVFEGDIGGDDVATALGG